MKARIIILASAFALVAGKFTWLGMSNGGW